MWASSTANALRVSTASRTSFPPAFSLTRCFSTVLEGLKYASSHEWVRHEGSVATVGITDHAQDHLGEVVFVDLPETGTSVSSGSSFGAVESVKATSDINSPISGEIVEVNTKLTETPGLCVSDPPKVVHFGGSDMSEATFLESPTNIGQKMKCHIPCDFSPSANKILQFLEDATRVNSSPYEDGWMIKVKPSSPSELESLMGAKEYTKFCEEEESH